MAQRSTSPVWFWPMLGVDRPLAWDIEYTVSQCTDTPNIIFVIKKRGFDQTLEMNNSLRAQLA